MNIPDEVIEEATQKGEGNDSDYQHIASWARREALLEAADLAKDWSTWRAILDLAQAVE